MTNDYLTLLKTAADDEDNFGATKAQTKPRVEHAKSYEISD